MKSMEAKEDRKRCLSIILHPYVLLRLMCNTIERLARIDSVCSLKASALGIARCIRNILVEWKRFRLTKNYFRLYISE